ncbi:hypothetical protein CRM22_005570 [Opisthorchis felineus]|uniref:Uncharacterized protein n=1 Tax=Opisthorchis felineus TaxID=147828 RepID=A0A4S2LQL6_OPIFE|nr:hypothetical protein CRM22_005570 [Opisthorchis felineus]
MIVDSSTTSEADSNSYASRLLQYMHDIRPSPTRQISKPTQLHPNLATCDFVFVGVDAVRKPLQPPYEGPFRMISRKGKSFVIDRDGREDTVGIDRFEVAYVYIQSTLDDEHTVNPSTTQSRSTSNPPSTNTAHTPSLTKPGRHRSLPVRIKD